MMQNGAVKKGSTDRSIYAYIIDATDGTPEQGVTYATSGLALWYRRPGAAAQAVTPVELAALTTAHADGGIIHIDDGLYRVDMPDAAFATGVPEVVFGGSCTGMIVLPVYVALVDYNPEDGVRLGLTALPNAAADAAGGLPISDAGAFDIDGISASNIVSAVLAGIIEGSITLQQSQRLQLAALVGKVSGAPTGPIVFRDTGDTTDRISATVDEDGNRSAVTLDLT